MKQQIADLNHSKIQLEQECAKLKHQIRLSTIEREKYVAVLAVRDRQIHEIRREMSQLQDVVNDQLLELQNNVFKLTPSNANFAGIFNSFKKNLKILMLKTFTAPNPFKNNLNS